MNWVHKRHKIIYKYFRSLHLLKSEGVIYTVTCIYNRLYGRILTSIANCKGIYFQYSNVYVDKLLSVLLLRRKYLPVYSLINHCNETNMLVKKAKTIVFFQKCRRMQELRENIYNVLSN